jgi:NADP-dependent 3-hydroxy acid dehydrogenase YdfG
VNALVSELFGLEDQVAVATGASGVLGGEIARGLAAAGARVGLKGTETLIRTPGRGVP